MGIVFTPEQLSARKIPSLQNYGNGLVELKQELENLYNQGRLHSATLYGSSVDNPSDVRVGSDVDIFVILYSMDAQQELQRLRSLADKIYLPIEINPLITVEQAKQGLHGMQQYFRACLEASSKSGYLIGNDPFGILAKRLANLTPLQEFITFQEDNLRRLSRESTESYNERHCQFLSRLFNYPSFIPTELFFIRHKTIPTKNGRLLSRKERILLLKDEFPEIGAEPLEHISSMYEAYREFLETIVTSTTDPDVSEYKKLLDEITSLYPEIDKFIRDCLIFSVSTY